MRICVAALLVLNLASAARADFTPLAGWDHQIYPSYLIATAAIRVPDEDNETEEQAGDEPILGDRQGVLGVKIEAPEAETPVTVTISGDAIMEESVYSGVLDEEGVVYNIFPKIKYDYAALTATKQTVPVTVTYTVEIGDEEPEERTETITLHSVNDCPFAIINGENVTDVSFVFAAYVNEQHPFVDKLLREALNEGVVDSFTGYQSGDPAEVYRQVYALWNALSERDIRYSNITASAAENRIVYSQHVRLIDESINNAQANCVDGSVLLASLLRKIDIEPVLVYVPGHCYLAFYADKEQKQLIGLETTLLGSTASDGEHQIPGVDDVVDKATQEKNSWGTFCDAIAMGTADLAEHKEQFEAKNDADYQLVPIAWARNLGILPIAFDSSEDFQSAASTDE